MTSLRIGIIEDDLVVARSIYVMLQRIGYAPIKPVRNYEDALKMISAESPELLLVDIVLATEPDGIQLAATVNKEFGIPFIFLTANSDAATVSRAKEVNPYAYLIKPFYEHDLYSSIEIAFNNYNQKRKIPPPNNTVSNFSGSIFIKESNVFHKVQLRDILYIKTDHVYLNIYTSGKTYLNRSKLDDFIKDYLPESFIRVHRSYVVNSMHIDAIYNLFVKIGDKEIPLHKNYKLELLKSINSLK